MPFAYSTVPIQAGTIIQPNDDVNTGYYVVNENVNVGEIIFGTTNAYILADNTSCIIRLRNIANNAIIGEGVNATLPPTNQIINLHIYQQCPVGQLNAGGGGSTSNNANDYYDDTIDTTYSIISADTTEEKTNMKNLILIFIGIVFVFILFKKRR